MEVRAVIVEDHPIVVEGLRMLLHQGGVRVVEVLDNSHDLLDVWMDRKPSVCLVDVNVPPDGSSLGAIRHLTTLHPAKVVGMSAQHDPSLINRVVDAGAIGYISKVADPWEIAPLLQAASRGEMVFDRRSAALAYRASRSRHASSRQVGFTERELAILQGVAQGLDNHSIARMNSISRSTVAGALSQIFRKLDVRDRAQAVALAVSRGLIDSPDSRSPNG